MASRQLSSVLFLTVFSKKSTPLTRSPTSSFLPGHVFHCLYCSPALLLSISGQCHSFRAKNDGGDHSVYGTQHCRLDFCTFMFATSIHEADLKKKFLASFLQDDGPYIYLYDILLHVITTRCALKSCIFRQDVVDTLKKANAKGTFFFSS